MPLKNDGLQVQEYIYDFDTDGGAQEEITLSTKDDKQAIPVGAIIKAVTMKVLTLFVTGSGATLVYGNGDAASGYSGSAISVGSLTDNALFNGWDNAASLLWDDSNDHQIPVNVSDADDGKFSITIGTGTFTAGKAIFLVEYLNPSLS